MLAIPVPSAFSMRPDNAEVVLLESGTLVGFASHIVGKDRVKVFVIPDTQDPRPNHLYHLVAIIIESFWHAAE